MFLISSDTSNTEKHSRIAKCEGNSGLDEKISCKVNKETNLRLCLVSESIPKEFSLKTNTIIKVTNKYIVILSEDILFPIYFWHNYDINTQNYSCISNYGRKTHKITELSTYLFLNLPCCQFWSGENWPLKILSLSSRTRAGWKNRIPVRKTRDQINNILIW